VCVLHKKKNIKKKTIVSCKSVTGVLKGYDQLLNLVLDEVQEQVQGIYIPF
jgi:small nuclear ribonucleoprotein (snRNP)-like protein